MKKNTYTNTIFVHYHPVRTGGGAKGEPTRGGRGGGGLIPKAIGLLYGLAPKGDPRRGSSESDDELE